MLASRMRAAVALLLVVSIFSLSAGSARATFPPEVAARLQGSLTGQLFTRGSQPVNVNGIQTNSGATILSGATIQTPDIVGATVALGLLGYVDIAPNTRLLLEFGSDRKVKVTLLEGCLVLRINQGSYGAIHNGAGEKIVSNDAARLDEAALDVCLPKGAPAPIVNQGAAVNAGSGAEMGAATTASKGVSAAFWWGMAGAGGALGLIFYLVQRGEDPSLSS